MVLVPRGIVWMPLCASSDPKTTPLSVGTTTVGAFPGVLSLDVQGTLAQVSPLS